MRDSIGEWSAAGVGRKLPMVIDDYLEEKSPEPGSVGPLTGNTPPVPAKKRFQGHLDSRGQDENGTTEEDCDQAGGCADGHVNSGMEAKRERRYSGFHKHVKHTGFQRVAWY